MPQQDIGMLGKRIRKAAGGCFDLVMWRFWRRALPFAELGLGTNRKQEEKKRQPASTRALKCTITKCTVIKGTIVN